MENRVYCLYRVSTDKQVDHDDKNQADIPMQRKSLSPLLRGKGLDNYPRGAGGRRFRPQGTGGKPGQGADHHEHAKQGKFDILLVFMFDRIGRIADETPFVVEWFVKNGVRVWSTQRGSSGLTITPTSSPTTSALAG